MKYLYCVSVGVVVIVLGGCGDGSTNREALVSPNASVPTAADMPPRAAPRSADTVTQESAGPPPMSAPADGKDTAVVKPANGLYAMGVRLEELGGFEVPFQVELVFSDGEPLVIQQFIVRATDGESASEPIANLGPLPVSSIGTFEARSGPTVMPAAFSPTGSDVRLDLIFEGRIASETFLCGKVRGELLTISTALEDSSFGLEPWAGRSDMPPAACEARDSNVCERMAADACPELDDGLIEEFVSCGEGRTFEVHLPSDHTPDRRWPVLFLYHGLGGSHEGLADYTGLLELIDDIGFILVVPSSRRLPVEWDQFSLRDSPDLAWFDDINMCMQAQLGADPNRIYVSGMSAGGLYSAFLGLARSDKVAAVAAMSGGLIINYPPSIERKVPILIGWGGPSDIAVEQNFNTFANDLIKDFTQAGHFVIGCDHGAGHVWDRALNRPMWSFFDAHPLNGPTRVETRDLPGIFPDYCLPASPAE